jgi:hypothetical protein
MALNKSKKSFPCLIHCLCYTFPFILITQDWRALLAIFVSHFIFDRWPFLIRRIIWFKNHFNFKGEYPAFDACNSTGYYDDSPYNTWPPKNLAGHKAPDWWGKPRHFFITIWLYIITDNTFHLLCNYLAIKYLGQ